MSRRDMATLRIGRIAQTAVLAFAAILTLAPAQARASQNYSAGASTLDIPGTSHRGSPCVVAERTFPERECVAFNNTCT
eukprot:320552-Chlamydomonas_euryale.AAC.35